MQWKITPIDAVTNNKKKLVSLDYDHNFMLGLYSVSRIIVFVRKTGNGV